MRIEKVDGEYFYHTLEEDIVETWKKHNLEVIEETYKDNTWIIKAIPIKESDDE